MKLDPKLKTSLAMALAIRRRDEVAIQQFARAMANRVLSEFEERETRRGRISGTEARKKAQQRLASAMASRVQTLKMLVDADGMAWLKQHAMSID